MTVILGSLKLYWPESNQLQINSIDINLYHVCNLYLVPSAPPSSVSIFELQTVFWFFNPLLFVSIFDV